MRRVMGAMMGLAAGAGVAAAQLPEPFAEAELAELRAIKLEVWPRLYREADTDALDRFLSEDFVILRPDGSTSTKAEELAGLASGGGQGPADFVYTIAQIVRADDDVAIIYGRGDSTRTDALGAPCHHRYWSSNTLRRVDGEWRAVMSHVSGVTCTPI